MRERRSERATCRPAIVLAGLGIAIVLAAGSFDAEALYVPGVGLLALVAASVGLVALGRRGAAVRRLVPVRRVVEGEPLGLVVEVRRGPLALPGAEVVDPVTAGPLALRGRRRITVVRAQTRLERRGRHTLAAPTLVLRDPLGLATRTVVGDGSAEILVLPRTSALRAPDGGGSSALSGVGLQVRSVGAEIDPDGLRPYRPGAPAARIYWPALARQAGLVERRRQPEPETQPLVVLDPRGADDLDQLDAAVRAAASLCLELARRGGCGLLLGGERRPASIDRELTGWPAAHARLAVVAAGDPSPSLAALTSRRGTLVYVVARALARPPRALDVAPRGTRRLLVLPGRLPGRAAAFEVAGCHGYELDRVARRRGLTRPREAAA